MNAKRLWIRNTPDHAPTLDDFIWRRAANGPSSFRANFDPSFEQLGDLMDRNRDGVFLATAVFLADRTTPRLKGWQRDLRVVVPVLDPPSWTSVVPQIERTLSFLTSDTWQLKFVSGPTRGRRTGSRGKSEAKSTVDLVSLFSGGADSMCGAIQALSEGNSVTLVSHWDWSVHAGIQTSLVADLVKLFGHDIKHVQIEIGTRAKQIGGATFLNAPSRRSRSLLFVLLGLAVASIGQPAPMQIAENGFASLNPPLAPERRASLSTRTTHPTFLEGLRGILQASGAHTDFRNPFAPSTKGEMFTSVTRAIGHEAASRLLSKTHSCSHARWAGKFHRAPDTQCGVCFGCMVRRGAFIASGLEDRTVYLATDGTIDQREFLTPNVRAHIEATRYAVTKRLGPADVLAMALPSDYDLEAALNLIRRGFGELSSVELPDAVS